MKLLYRITIAIICIVFSTGLILTSYSLSVQNTLITSQLDKTGKVLANLLATSVSSHLISYDFYTIKLLFEPLKRDNDIVSVSLIGTDNFIKMHSDISKIGTKSSYIYKEEDFKEENIFKKVILNKDQHHYLFFSPVTIDHNRNGVIQITLSDNESLLLIRAFGKRILILTAVVLLAGIIAAYLISRQISNPVIELTQDMKRFLMKRPQHKIDQDSANEITILKHTFHTMMAEIQYSIDFRVKTEKMAVLGHLSSVLAHEVKNPLEPIKGSAEILKLKYPDNEDIIKYTRIIQSEVSELILFLDSFLDVARTNDIKMKKININETVRDTLLLLDYTLNNEQMRVDLDLESELPAVSGESSMIKQVFLNLILNVIQAKIKESGLIEITTTSDDSFIHIFIKDYGSGVEKSIIKEIFQPFFTTKEDGSGIGLSTSRHIINQHGGSILIESEKDCWTEVHITLPKHKGNEYAI